MPADRATPAGERARAELAHAIRTWGRMKDIRAAADMLEADAREIQALDERVRALEAALAPFTHPDLCEQFGGNVEGAESPVFGRNKAVLRLKDFRSARAALRPGASSEEGNNG